MQTYSQKEGTIDNRGLLNQKMMPVEGDWVIDVDNTLFHVAEVNLTTGIMRNGEGVTSVIGYKPVIKATIHPYQIEGVPCINLRRSAEEVINELVSDDEINKAWANARFGDISKRDVIKETLSSFARDYSSGSTARAIVNELGLAHGEKLTEKGYKYLIASESLQYSSQPTQHLTDAQIEKLALKEVNDGIHGYPNDKVGEWTFNLCKEYFIKGLKYKPSQQQLPQEIILDGNNNLLNVKW